VDIYIRTGLYPAALPSGLGTEAAGVVEEVGPGGRSRRVCRRPVRGLQRGARDAGRSAGGAAARCLGRAGRGDVRTVAMTILPTQGLAAGSVPANTERHWDRGKSR
jgi:NADPH:quinone reductase-like Zn-dependent oxidoreductase